MKRLLAAAAIVGVALAFGPKRNWETGTLVDSAEGTRTVGGGAVAIARSSSGQNSNPAISSAGDFATAAALAANGPHTYALQGFVIRGDHYVFMVRRAMTYRHNPNVTIKGPIRYATDKDKLYFLDDDGREFQTVVMKKELLDAPEPPQKPTSDDDTRKQAFKDWLNQKLKNNQ